MWNRYRADIEVMLAGAYFGEIALFTDQARRMASVIAAVPCSCYFLHRDDFEVHVPSSQNRLCIVALLYRL